MSSVVGRIKELIQWVLEGNEIDEILIMELAEIATTEVRSIEALLLGANQIRERFVGKRVDLCTIMNVKSGKCSEDCKYCSQSVHYETNCEEYGLLDYQTILKRAKEVEASGAHRFSLVTSGRSISSEGFIDQLVEIYTNLRKDTGLSLCASHGMATQSELLRLKVAGVTMFHHNVETATHRYSDICTTHTYQDRVNTIQNAQKVGLQVCSGGIIGMGETLQERLKMAFEIRELGIKSIPLNVLMPIAGTPMEDQIVLQPEEILMTFALYRYILPDAMLRYAGGRMALKHLQQKGFEAGVNAALVGNFLTTVGSQVEEDLQMIENAGLKTSITQGK